MQVVLGTLLAALVPVVGFNAVMTSEHFASFLVSWIPISKALLQFCQISTCPVLSSLIPGGFLWHMPKIYSSAFLVQ